MNGLEDCGKIWSPLTTGPPAEQLGPAINLTCFLHFFSSLQIFFTKLSDKYILSPHVSYSTVHSL